MPPIREHANSIFTDVTTAAHRRSKGSFYQYGEDYITAYDRVGLTASPTPRSQHRTSSVHSDGSGSGGGGGGGVGGVGAARSLRRSASVRSAISGRSGRSSKSAAAAGAAGSSRGSLRLGSPYSKTHWSRGSGATEGTYSSSGAGTARERERERERERDLESGGPVSEPESELEKAVVTETRERRSWWRRWRRFVVILMVVLGLAGLAVGIIFGTRPR